jgi:transposase-like protein
LFQQIDSDWEEIVMTQAERDIRRKLRIFKHAEESGNVAKTCRYFGISRSTYYVWKQRYAQHGGISKINTLMAAYEFALDKEVIEIIEKHSTSIK